MIAVADVRDNLPSVGQLTALLVVLFVADLQLPNAMMVDDESDEGQVFQLHKGLP